MFTANHIVETYAGHRNDYVLDRRQQKRRPHFRRQQHRRLQDRRQFRFYYVYVMYF